MRLALSILLLAVLPALGQLSNAKLSNARISNAQAPVAAGGGGGFDPTTDATVVAWWDASTGTGLTNSSSVTPPTSGDSIQGAKDISGHNQYLTRTVNWPTWVSGVQNGKGVFRFNGSNQEFIIPTAVATTLNGNDTPMIFACVFANSKVAAAGTIWEFMKSLGSPNPLQRVVLLSDNTYRYLRNDGTTQKTDTTGTWDNSWHTLIVSTSGTVATMYVDGAVIGSANVDVDVNTLATADQALLGSSDAGVYYGGDIGECGFLTPTTTAVADIQTYLKNKWATP